MSAGAEPLVTVVIATYNQAPYLREAIESALAQDYASVEVLVVDNSSTDDTPAILASYPQIRSIRQDNRGPSAARNRGTQEAHGEYVCYLDGDDRLRPDCISARLALLQERDAQLITGSYRIVDHLGNEIVVDSIAPPERTETTFWQAVAEMRCPTCGLMVHRQTVLDLGGWDETLRIAEDSDLLIRVAKGHRCLVDHEPRADYRQVPGSISRNYLLWFDSYLRMLRKNGDGLSYRRHAMKAFANLCRLQIFSKIIRDPTVQNRWGTLLGLLIKRPRLIPFGFYYAFTKLIGR